MSHGNRADKVDDVNNTQLDNNIADNNNNICSGHSYLFLIFAVCHSLSKKHSRDTFSYCTMAKNIRKKFVKEFVVHNFCIADFQYILYFFYSRKNYETYTQDRQGRVEIFLSCHLPDNRSGASSSFCLPSQFVYFLSSHMGHGRPKGVTQRPYKFLFQSPFQALFKEK